MYGNIVVAILAAFHVHSLPEAAPAVTPLAVLDKRDPAMSTYGYSFNSAASTYSPVVFATASWNFLTSGAYFGLCTQPATSCVLATGCSGVYKLYPSAIAPSLCAEGKCGTDTLYTSMGGEQAQTRIWCDVTNQVGIQIYRITAAGAVDPLTTGTSSSRSSSSGSSSRSSSSGNAASTDSSSSTTSPSSGTSSSSSSSSGSSTNIGAIVGGVIGGLAVLGAIATLLVFLILRHRRQKSATPPGVSEANQGYMNQGYTQDPKVGYPPNYLHQQPMQGYSPQPAVQELASTPVGPYGHDSQRMAELPANSK